MMVFKERPYKPRREPRVQRRTPAPDPAKWNPPASRDDDAMPAIGRWSRSTIASSSLAGLLGLLTTGLLLWPLFHGWRHAEFGLHMLAAPISWIALTAWIPVILFAYAFRPLAHSKQLQQTNRALLGVSDQLAPYSGPLGVGRVRSFLSVSRRALAAAITSAVLGTSGLIAMIVGGIVIEGHKLHGTLGNLSMFVLGAFFVLAIVVGVSLPAVWWRRDRRMRLIARDAHGLDASSAGV